MNQWVKITSYWKDCFQMKGKQISCIIPCYNCERYISKTIESLLDQTIKPFEIILVNDGSTDNTLEILRRTEEQNKDIVKVINVEKNKGVSHARNYGVKSSRGDYILFIDSDDIAEPKLIERYHDRLKELNNDVEDKYILCFSAYIQIDENGNQISEIGRGIQVEPEEILGYEFYRNIIPTTGVLVKKNYFMISGGFNERIGYSEDWDLWLRLACLGGFAYVDESLIKIRRYKKNASSKVAKMLDAEKAILKQYDIEYIKEAVFKRRLGIEINTIDYVSILFRLHYWENGLLELKNLLEKGYRFYNIYFYLGLYYLKQKNLDLALDSFEQTISVKIDHGAALNNAGALYLFQGNKKSAEDYLRLATEYFPSYIDASHNYKLLEKENISFEELKFTWRELRRILTIYNG